LFVKFHSKKNLCFGSALNPQLGLDRFLKLSLKLL